MLYTEGHPATKLRFINAPPPKDQPLLFDTGAFDAGVPMAGIYTPESAAATLEMRVTHTPNLLTPQQQGFLDWQRYEDRVWLGGKQEQHVYQGTWLRKIEETGTCLPWALAGTLHIDGRTIHPEAFAYMLNESLTLDHDGQSSGYSFPQAKQQMQYYHPKDVTMQHDYFLRYSPDRTRDAHHRLWQAQNLQMNTHKIVEALKDNKKPLVVVQDMQTYIDSHAQRTHVIGLVGYHTMGGFTDIQVYDPNLGLFWTSAEHVAKFTTHPEWTRSQFYTVTAS